MLPRGRALWVRATGARIFAEVNLGNHAASIAVIDELLAAATAAEPYASTRFGFCIAITAAGWLARADLAQALVERLEALHEQPRTDALFEAWLVVAHAAAAWIGVRPPGAAQHAAADALARFDASGDVHGVGYINFHLGAIHAESGQLRAQTTHLDAMRAAGERAGYSYYVEGARWYGARAWSFAGNFDEVLRRVAGLSARTRRQHAGSSAGRSSRRASCERLGTKRRRRSMRRGHRNSPAFRRPSSPRSRSPRAASPTHAPPRNPASTDCERSIT